MSAAEIEGKFMLLAGPVLGTERASAVVRAVRALPDARNISRLTGLLRVAASTRETAEVGY